MYQAKSNSANLWCKFCLAALPPCQFQPKFNSGFLRLKSIANSIVSGSFGDCTNLTDCTELLPFLNESEIA
jgi:hypothetical protein